MQNTAVVKWKTPNWVPAEARLLTKQSNPNTPVRINTPWITDPPEGWARWLWRYPREATTCPGILRAWYGINLSSIRGLLVVTARAPCGVTAPGTPNKECVPHSRGTTIINTRIVPASSR